MRVRVFVPPPVCARVCRFYWEETTLAAGLFDDAPRLRETMLEFMRLRAVRVEADVGPSRCSALLATLFSRP